LFKFQNYLNLENCLNLNLFNIRICSNVKIFGSSKTENKTKKWIETIESSHASTMHLFYERNAVGEAPILVFFKQHEPTLIKKHESKSASFKTRTWMVGLYINLPNQVRYASFLLVVHFGSEINEPYPLAIHFKWRSRDAPRRVA
jgi:hypothetical protein